MAITTRRRVGDIFCMASHRSIMTSPKPLTDKPDHKQTSRKDKQTSREHVPDSSRQDWLFLWIGIYSWDPESWSISHYINPSPLWCAIHFTLQIWQEHIKSNCLITWGSFCFYWVKYFIVHDDFKTQKTAEPSTCPASITITPTTPKEKEVIESMGHALDTARREERLLQNTLWRVNHYWHTRLQKLYQDATSIFLFDWRKNYPPPPPPHLRKSITNFKKPLEVRLKLAVTLRHLSTGESYYLLQYHWRVGRTTLCKFVPQVCKAILKKFQHEYLMCPSDPEDWKKIEERFRNRWNVPHAVSALDAKYIAINKPKKSDSEYFDADYKFLWVNMRASGSSSDAQIFNRSKLKRRIENGTLGLPPPEPLGPGRPNLHYFLLGDDDFARMPWLVKPYSRQLTREERVANYRISRGRRVVENSFGTLVKRFRVLLTTMEQRPKVVRDSQPVLHITCTYNLCLSQIWSLYH